MTPMVLIPARLAATRLPGKPLADIAGVPMIVRVLRRAQAAGVGEVVVAAGDAEIVRAVEAAGGRAVLTDPALPSGSDRIMAALAACDPQGRCDVVVNLQGDLPFVSPEVLEGCARVLAQDPGADLSTVVGPASADDVRSPDVVKAIVARNPDGRSGRALYFTRGAPYGEGPDWHHIGVYGYRRDALARFTAAPPSPLERRERLEQLRALELGLAVGVAVVPTAPLSVDTPQELEAARAFAAAARL